MQMPMIIRTRILTALNVDVSITILSSSDNESVGSMNENVNSTIGFSVYRQIGLLSFPSSES